MGLFGFGGKDESEDEGGREIQLAKESKGNSVTAKRLTTTKRGFGAGADYLADKSVLDLIEENEQPHFLFPTDGIGGHRIQRQTTSNITPDDDYRTIMVVTDERILLLSGNNSGDRSNIIDYADIIRARFNESKTEGVVSSGTAIRTIKLETEDETYYFQTSEFDENEISNAVKYVVEKSDISDSSIQTDFEVPNTAAEDAIKRVDEKLEQAATVNNATGSQHNSTQNVSRDYPSDWNSRRKQVYKRDNYTCQNCGSMGGPRGNAELHAHHIVPKSRGGTHATSNLVSLCKQCHNTVHSKSKQAPVSHQQPIETSPRYGEVSDAIVTDIATVIDTMIDVINLVDSPDISLQQKANEIEQTAIELRPFIMEMTDAIEILETLPSSNYPGEVIVHDKEFMDHSLDVMLLSLEWLETRSNQLNNVVTQIYSCPDCGRSVNIDDEDFCSDCGSELKLGFTCPSCGEEVFGSDSFCSSCGESLDGVEDKARLEKSIEEVKDDTEDFDDLAPKLDELNKMFEKRMDVINKHS